MPPGIVIDDGVGVLFINGDINLFSIKGRGIDRGNIFKNIIQGNILLVHWDT